MGVLALKGPDSVLGRSNCLLSLERVNLYNMRNWFVSVNFVLVPTSKVFGTKPVPQRQLRGSRLLVVKKLAFGKF